ncbi:GNVR domain-containing protein [Pontiellaceae bacterium B12227]|nr:GNVR domain-containing protein [Pontiellaceae bacterium B12227]
MKHVCVVLGAVLIALAPVIVIAATVYTLMLPNIYSSSVRITVSEDAPEVNPFATEGEFQPYNPYFLRTQFELIQSKPVLYEVVKRLNLQQEWGRGGEKLPREIAYKILRNSVQVFQQRDTSLLVISVKRDNPDEAAEIANELAVTYRDFRLDSAQKNARRKIETIEEAMEEQHQRIEDAEKKVQKIGDELNVPENAGPTETQGIKYRPYRRAIADLESEDFIYNQLKTKHRQEIITLKVPRNVVELIDMAEPNRRPVSPNLFMNVLLSVFLAGFIGIVGGILLAVGLQKRA